MKEKIKVKFNKISACTTLGILFCVNCIPAFANGMEKNLDVQTSAPIQIENGTVTLLDASNNMAELSVDHRGESIKFAPHYSVSDIKQISANEYEYEDSKGLYDFSVQAVEDGLVSDVRLINKNAKPDYPVIIDLPDGWSVDLYKDEYGETVDGSLVVYDDKKNVVAATTCPVATDATGRIIDNYFQFNGNKLYQVVDTENAKYPVEISYKMVLADATLGFEDYFSYGKFIKRTDASSGSYTSLSLGERKFDINVAYTVDKAWDTVVRKFYAVDSNWTSNRSGMKDQYMCHRNFAPNKVPWNLEPTRPDVGYAKTVAARCNPGNP